MTKMAPDCAIRTDADAQAKARQGSLIVQRFSVVFSVIGGARLSEPFNS